MNRGQEVSTPAPLNERLGEEGEGRQGCEDARLNSALTPLSLEPAPSG